VAAYLVSVPAAPFVPPQPVPTPTIGVPPLPPPPTIPILPAPIRVDVRPTPIVVNPPSAVPDTPAVPAVPVIPPEDPVFSGLDDLKKDLGQQPGVQTVTGTVVGTGVVATAGYVLLSPRLAYWLLSALLARRTVWKPFDPLEVVYAWERENGVGGAEDDSLQGMVDAGSDGPADGHGTTNG
jgi:hypothetical protein